VFIQNAVQSHHPHTQFLVFLQPLCQPLLLHKLLHSPLTMHFLQNTRLTTKQCRFQNLSPSLIPKTTEGPEKISNRIVQFLLSLFLILWSLVILFLFMYITFTFRKHPQTRGEISRCNISLSMQFMNNGFYNPDPPHKKNNKIPAPFGAKTSWVDSTLKRLLPLYFSILILDLDQSDLCTI